MLSPSGRISLAIAAVAAAHGASTFAQESLRNSLEFERFNQQRAANFKDQSYNLRLGPAVVNVSANTGMTYNDNINNSEFAAQDDFIFRVGAQTAMIWQINDNNQLALDLAVGYAYYINHPGLSRPEVSPNSLSDLSYDVWVGAVRFNVHDRFNYTQSPVGYGTGAVANQTDLGRFRNTIGLTSVLKFVDGSISAGYDHGNNVFFNKNFSNSDYSSEMFFVRGQYQLNAAMTTGLEASMGITQYDQKVRADNRNYTAGPFLQWNVNSAITVDARVGVSTYEISRQGTLGDQSQPLSYYASLDVKHRLNKQITQILSFSRDTSQGVGLSSNFLEVMSVRHSATWKIFQDLSLVTQLFYEKSDDSGKGFGAFIHESYNRYGGGLSLDYPILKNAMAELSWQHMEKDSDHAFFSYSANVVALTLNYRF